MRHDRLLNKGAVVALYGMLLLPYAQPAHTVYADPILRTATIKVVQAIKMPELSPQAVLETLPVPLAPYGTYANDYAPGNCTLYVASRIKVPDSMGNANNWDDYARSIGVTVSSVPKVGAVAQSDTDSYLGHVAIVEAVNGDIVTISEMNAQGWGVIDTREALPGEFIYLYF